VGHASHLMILSPDLKVRPTKIGDFQYIQLIMNHEESVRKESV